MDFIEKIIGLSPDGGSGSLEILLFLIPVLMVGVLFTMRRKQHDTE